MSDNISDLQKKFNGLWEDMKPIQKERQEIMSTLKEKLDKGEKPTEEELARLEELSANLRPLETQYNDVFTEYKTEYGKVLKEKGVNHDSL